MPAPEEIHKEMDNALDIAWDQWQVKQRVSRHSRFWAKNNSSKNPKDEEWKLVVLKQDCPNLWFRLERRTNAEEEW